MNAMTYRGYSARIEFDAEDRIFVGQLAGITDVAVFHGVTVEELESAFHETVDHYLEVSARTGAPAQKPYSGKLSLRVSPETHAAIATAAQLAGSSLNQWATQTLSRAAQGAH
jgi:predicted HicB family RNase H-like nuclease